MRAMLLRRQGPAEASPLQETELPDPQPGPGEALLEVLACGVCRTDLHIVEGDLPPRRLPLVPGHQVVGRVLALGPGATPLQCGDLAGAAWLHASCGACRFCRGGRENLCDAPVFTGYDVDGGYASLCKVQSNFAYPLEDLEPLQAAPLLCAGIIGLRALRRSGLKPGGRVAFYGFGGSAHVAIQVARHWGCAVHVFTRSPGHQRLARELGAAEAGSAPPAEERFDAAVLFAPAGDLVPVALAALEKGATLAVAGIHLSAIPPLDYQRHLFEERQLASVTANTREDGRELMRLAREIPIRTRVRVYSLDRANEALLDLKRGRIDGTAVLTAS